MNQSWQNPQFKGQYQQSPVRYPNQPYDNQYGGQFNSNQQFLNHNNQGKSQFRPKLLPTLHQNNSMQNHGSVSSETCDPTTAHMRVFVGNINTQNVTQDELYERFVQYGMVSGVSLHRGYAFVQYNDIQSARTAVQAEHGNFISGQQADIKIASESKKNGNESLNGNKQGFNSLSRGRGLRGGLRGRGVTSRGGQRGGASTRGSGRGGLNRGRGAARGGGRGRGRGSQAAGSKFQSGRIEKSSRKPTLPPPSTVTKAVQPPTPPDSNPMPPPPLPPADPMLGSLIASKYLDLKTLKTDLVGLREKVNALILSVAKAEAIAASAAEDQEEDTEKKIKEEVQAAK